MNKKLIFRILGALASALIIVSVFIPFVNVTGYTMSLWETFDITNSLYLPIMIIVFGAIGVIFFALNIKTEFAYMSTGAISFFIIMQTIDIVNQGVFNTLSVGYYCLAIGAILTGLMAFLTNLKTKQKNEKIDETVKSQPEHSMMNQIDNLYDNQPNSLPNEMSPIQPIDNVVEPITVQPLESVTPIQPIEEIQPTIQVQPIPEVAPVLQETVIPDATPVIPQQAEVQSIPEVASVLQETVIPDATPVIPQQAEVQPIPEVASVLQEPVIPDVTPVVPQQVQEQPVNPVVQEFTQQTNSNALIQEQPTNIPEVANIPISSTNEPVNPVVQEFTSSGSTVVPQQNSNELDIFGQPINK